MRVPVALHPILDMVSIFYFDHSDRHVLVSHNGFNFTSLLANDGEHFFHVLIFHLYIKFFVHL